MDDTATNLRVLSAQLQALGCRFKCTSSSRSALEILEASVDNDPFQVLLTDKVMPGMNGLELAKAIRSKGEEFSGLRIVLLSSFNERYDDSDDEKAWFDRKINKPLKLSSLKTTLLSLTKGQAKPADEKSKTLLTPTSHLMASSPSEVMRVSKRSQPASKEVSSRPTTKPSSEAAGIKWRGKVLLVEDNKVNQKLAKRIIEKAGIEVEVADNGKEAVEAVQNGDFELVLMDCQMPVMDGFQATRQIRRSHVNQHTPIIALTGLDSENERQACLQAGMNDFITKPFTQEQLHNAIIQWLPSEK